MRATVGIKPGVSDHDCVIFNLDVSAIPRRYPIRYTRSMNKLREDLKEASEVSLNSAPETRDVELELDIIQAVIRHCY